MLAGPTEDVHHHTQEAAHYLTQEAAHYHPQEAAHYLTQEDSHCSYSRSYSLFLLKKLLTVPSRSCSQSYSRTAHYAYSRSLLLFLLKKLLTILLKKGVHHPTKEAANYSVSDEDG
jgi:hypothetical protein